MSGTFYFRFILERLDGEDRVHLLLLSHLSLHLLKVILIPMRAMHVSYTCVEYE